MLILHALLKRMQTIDFRAGRRGDGGKITPAGLGNHAGRCRRVFAAGHSHVRQLLQKFGALLQCLTMRNDLADLGRLHARQGKQTVIYAQADAANNREVVLLHEVVHRIDRTCCAVFQRQNAVLAQALLDGGENLVKCCAEEHARMLEEFIAGLLRIRAFDALAGDSCCGREQLRRLLQRCFEKRRKRCFFVQQIALVAAAEREQQPVEAHGLLLQILRRGLYDLRQLLALPPSVQNRQAVRFFIRRDPRSRLHPLGKQLQKLRVDPVDLCSVIRKFHSDIHPFRKYKRKTRHSVICAALRT